MLELGDEVLRERAEQAADHPLLLLAEEAAVLVGDVAQPPRDHVDVADLALARRRACRGGA